MLHSALILLGPVFSIAAVWHYLIETIKGKTKPRVVSWFTWSLLTGIAASASWSDHQYPAAISLTAAALETFTVAAIGFRAGHKSFERLDIFCQIGALVGIGAWWLYDSPAIAVVATIFIDFVGTIPTLVHSWKRPAEEAWATYFLSVLSALATLLAAAKWQITAVAFPLYLFFIDALITAVIVWRKTSIAPAAKIPDSAK